MPRQFTRSQLRTRARQRADMVGSTFISDAEVNTLLSEHYTQLYELLVQSSLNYFETEATITGTGVEKYNLPTNFFGVVAVDFLYTAQYRIPLWEYMAPERTRYENLITGSRYPMAYAIIGIQGALPAAANQISILPGLLSAQQVRLRYIPAPIGLEDSDGATDATAIDGVSGWEELVVVNSAIDMLTKEESSTTSLERRKAELMERIESASQIRAWASPRRVVDIDEMNRFEWWRHSNYFAP